MFDFWTALNIHRGFLKFRTNLNKILWKYVKSNKFHLKIKNDCFHKNKTTQTHVLDWWSPIFCHREHTRSNYAMAIFSNINSRCICSRRRVKFHLLINSFEKCSLKRKKPSSSIRSSVQHLSIPQKYTFRPFLLSLFCTTVRVMRVNV